MDSAQDRRPVARLKYNKRRFDGGSEIELIRHIEKQQTVAQLHRLQARQQLLEVESRLREAEEPEASARSEAVPEPPQEPAAPAARGRWFETLLTGPLQMCVGLVGIMTALLAIATFARFRNEALLNQSRDVLKDCVKTLKAGIFQTIMSPYRLIRQAV